MYPRVLESLPYILPALTCAIVCIIDGYLTPLLVEELKHLLLATLFN
jgi:hypothetical protein